MERERVTPGTTGAGARVGQERVSAGYLTLYLALSLPIILSLFLVLIEGARMNAVRMQIELAADAAMNSVLGEFHRELLRQYDLFFVDASFGTDAPSDQRVEEHLREYMARNFESTGLLPLGSRKSFTALSVQDLHLTGTRYAVDQSAAALREQITAYMLADPVGERLSGLLATVRSYEDASLDESEWERRKADNDREMAELRGRAEELRVRKEAEGERVPSGEYEDPAQNTNSFRGRLALYQVLGSAYSVSEASAELPALLSHREVHEGTGLVPENIHGYGQAGRLLFDEYILEKCSHYRHALGKGLLSYQAEYILFGREADETNLNKMASRLLMLRAAACCAHLFSDEEKQTEAEGLATVVSCVLLVPEMMEVMKTAILLAWAYVEGLQDVKTLFAGGRVPLLKDSENWKTTMFSIFAPGVCTKGEKGGSGFSYEDYLRVFLFFMKDADKSRRLMDVMEMDIRCTEGNQNFRMDWCLDGFGMEASAASGFGYEYTIRRELSYN